MTQRIKGRGPIIAYDDITQTSTIDKTVFAGSPENTDALLEPQLNPKAVFSSGDSVDIEWTSTSGRIDGFIIAGVKDPESMIEIFTLSSSNTSIIPFEASKFSEKSILVKLRNPATDTVSIRIGRISTGGSGNTEIGYIAPIKILRDPSLSRSLFEFQVIDTSAKESSQSGQIFSGSGSVRRVLKISSAPILPSLMYGHPNTKKELNVLNQTPTLVNFFPNSSTLSGIGKQWENTSDSGSVTWSGVLSPSAKYVIKTFTLGDAARPSGLSVGDPPKELPFGSGSTEFTAPASGDLVISDTSSTPGSKRVNVVGVYEIEEFSERAVSVSSAIHSSGLSRPVLVSMSPDDPIWSPDTTILGIPEWRAISHLESADDRFNFELTITESL